MLRNETDRINKSERGQALLVVLLVSAVGLTIGLSLASRVTQETSLTTEIEESTRAFSAAEAGLEESAQHIGNINQTFSNTVGGGSYNVTITEAAGTDNPFKYPGKASSNQQLLVWLVGREADGSPDYADKYSSNILTVCWGESGGSEAAMAVSFYYKRPDSDGVTITIDGDDQERFYFVGRTAYDPTGGENLINNASSPPAAASGDCDGDYAYKAGLDFSSNFTSAYPYRDGTDTPLFMRLRPIVADGGKTPVALAPDTGAVLKTQGEIHTSTGTAAGGQTTKLIQFISHPVPPEIFDIAVYSEGALTK